MRTLGLNVFIASLALGAALTPSDIFNIKTLVILVQAMVVAFISIVGTFAFGRFVLRLEPIALLGAICGSGTCTPALNALEEETGSSAFTSTYTIPYVINNILLTMLGTIIIRFL